MLEFAAGIIVAVAGLALPVAAYFQGPPATTAAPEPRPEPPWELNKKALALGTNPYVGRR